MSIRKEKLHDSYIKDLRKASIKDLRDTFKETVSLAAMDYGREGVSKGLSTQNSNVADMHNKLMENDSYRETFYKYSNAISSPNALQYDSTLEVLVNKADQKDTIFCREVAQICALAVKNFPSVAKVRYYENRMLSHYKQNFEVTPD